MDKLDELASQNEDNMRFLSICCDRLDGAREIIERDDELKWRNVLHYFMEEKDKETAKRILGFKQVPFYVILDEDGSIEEMGNKVDLEVVVGKQTVHSPPEKSKTHPVRMDSPTDVRAFVLDDLDF